MMKVQTFSPTPTPAEAVVPIPLTRAWITRKELPTSSSCSATGTPMRSCRSILRVSLRPARGGMANGSGLRQRKNRESSTLTACAATVAMAAPAAPRWNPATSSRSPTMLTAQATATVYSGVLASPAPRSTAPRKLYATIKTMPNPQIRM